MTYTEDILVLYSKINRYSTFLPTVLISQKMLWILDLPRHLRLHISKLYLAKQFPMCFKLVDFYKYPGQKLLIKTFYYTSSLISLVAVSK